MYLVEGEEGGFRNIPVSIYWSIVTLTTVGYGDIAPITPFGQFLASIIMIMGYGIIAVPTGIVSAGVLYNRNEKEGNSDDENDLLKIQCNRCHSYLHTSEDNYCWKCGGKVN